MKLSPKKLPPNPELRQQRRGETFILAEEFLWGWFPIVTLLCYQVMAPLWTMAITILIATIFFAGLMQGRGLWGELGRRQAWPDLLLASFYILLLFVLLFVGLSYTTAGNAALILFLQVLFAFIYFNVFKGEELSAAHRAGVVLISLGAVLVLFPDQMGFNKGDLLVLLAAMIAPVGNRYQQRARRHVNGTTLLFVRNLCSLPLLFLLAWLLADSAPDLNDLTAIWWLLMINGLLMMGLSKIFWVEGLHRLTITKISALTALSPLFTMIFAFMVLDEIPDLRQLVGILPILLGGILITRPAGDTHPPSACRPGR